MKKRIIRALHKMQSANIGSIRREVFGSVDAKKNQFIVWRTVDKLIREGLVERPSQGVYQLTYIGQLAALELLEQETVETK